MMKKERAKGFVTGLLVMALMVGLVGTAAATIGKRTAELEYNGIKIRINDKMVTPTDANGNAVEPFSIDGTIYLPVRAVGSAIGYNVFWDDAEKTAILIDARDYKFWASAYMEDATKMKDISDGVRRATTLCQEMSFTQSTIGILSSSATKELWEGDNALIQQLREVLAYYEQSLINICVTEGTGEKIKTLYHELIEQLQKASDSNAGKGGKFTTYYSAALAKSHELADLCDEEFGNIMAKAQESLDKLEISMDDAVIKEPDTKTEPADTGSSTTEKETTDKGSTPSRPSGGDNESDDSNKNLQLYLSDKALLDAEYRAERADLVAEEKSAEDAFNKLLVRKPPADEMERNLALYKWEGATKAIEDCDENYQQELSALKEQYGI